MPPNVTLERKLTLYRGGREIQLLFLGRGHTGGDVVVYLPNERILCSRDLLLPGIPFMGDGHVDEWGETLDAFGELDFDQVLPGHGAPFAGKVRINQLKSYFTDLWNQVSRLHADGVTWEEAAGQVDMTVHGEFYPQIQEPVVDSRAVRRIYELWNGEVE
jgi:glyoxylase-like metal-dependent hydrolase (beta-lactamase superfamily II)